MLDEPSGVGLVGWNAQACQAIPVRYSDITLFYSVV